MSMTTFSSREFNHDVSKAKRASSTGPVFITERGRLAHVLLTFEEYKKITDSHTHIADLLAMPGSEETELSIPRFHDTPKPADLNLSQFAFGCSNPYGAGRIPPLSTPRSIAP